MTDSHVSHIKMNSLVGIFASIIEEFETFKSTMS